MRRHFVYTRREPLGVVAGIGAWNYRSRLLCGNPPSAGGGQCNDFQTERSHPLTALKLAEILQRSGLPDGVLTCCRAWAGDRTISDRSRHPGIAQSVSFTGGVASGKVMANSAASSLKEVTMELGGKSPLIVFDDADLDLAADIAMMANFFSSGQVYQRHSRLRSDEMQSRI